jgi:geranylgeranyl diphosphate synthase type II
VDLQELLERKRDKINPALNFYLPPQDEYPESIHKAIRYSVFPGGKRIRPILMLISAELFGLAEEDCLPAACAMEFVHTCSLILDDLPAMDDAEIRRGRPSVHRTFGEATAILAADALLMHAFALLCQNGENLGLSATRLGRTVRELARAAGSFGMIGGQQIDLEMTGHHLDFGTLEYIHSHKTGALFIASVELGGILAGAREDELAGLNAYAKNLGLAFQIMDDVLDGSGRPSQTGKDGDKDENKTTFVTLFGRENAGQIVAELTEAAIDSIGRFNHRAEALRLLARHLAVRTA